MIKGIFQLRRDSEADWLSAPNILGRGILRDGELGLNLDNGLIKIGDGVTHWVNLDYYGSNLASSGIPGPIGPQGIQGTQGVQGIAGQDGIIGVDGVQGSQGIQGVQGVQGTYADTGTQFLAGTGLELVYDSGANTLTIHSTGIDLVGIEGSGTFNYLPVWTSGSLLTNSNIYQDSGKIGINTTNTTHDLTVNGTFSAVSKSFNIPHPSKKNKRLVYGSLESPYHGIRLTGIASTVKGKAIIKLPNYIKKLVHKEDCTVQLTNYKHGKVLFVDKIDIAKNTITIKVAEPVNDEELEFFWDLTAIRKDIPQLIVEQ